MRIATISAGAAGMYCGTCMHDNTLARGLIARGHEVALLPTYTPLRTDEDNVASRRVFFGAINVYLQHKSALFRHTPWLVDKLLDRPRLLNWVARLGSASTDAADLGALTLSMLEGEEGHQAKELDKLVRWLEEEYRPDLVHLSLSLFLGFARRIRERLGVPIVCSLQGEDLFFDDLEEPWRARVLGEIRDRARDVDAFTATCGWYADRMAETLGLAREVIHVNRLGVPTADFAAIPEPAPSGRAPTLGYLARICPEKGLHLLLEAFREVAGRTDCRLRIAGYLGDKDRAFADEQRRRLDAWGLGDRVDWVGEVDRPGKVDFLASIDLFALPTVYREPKGLSALEALASARPVVVPRHGAFPEVLERTGGGVLFEPGSVEALAGALIELAGDPQRLGRLGREGRDGVRTHHDAEQMIADALATYEGVLGRQRPASVPADSAPAR